MAVEPVSVKLAVVRAVMAKGVEGAATCSHSQTGQ